MTRPTNGKAYRPDIDGLRAVAVLAVVAFHAFPEAVHGGFIGVDVAPLRDIYGDMTNAPESKLMRTPITPQVGRTPLPR